jgi:hypothetical protein
MESVNRIEKCLDGFLPGSRLSRTCSDLLPASTPQLRMQFMTAAMIRVAMKMAHLNKEGLVPMVTQIHGCLLSTVAL